MSTSLHRACCPSCSSPLSLHCYIQYLNDWQRCTLCGEMVFLPTAIAVAERGSSRVSSEDRSVCERQPMLFGGSV
jgi:hypothetical protein